MAASDNRRQKMLYLQEFFNHKTDRSHAATSSEIIEYLAEKGIPAVRQTVYEDIRQLKDYGMDIRERRGAKTGYYLAEREFSLSELKILVDSVQSSKFITEKKTYALIKKLDGLAADHEAKELNRQVYVRGRIKSDEDSVFKTVDVISKAMGEDKTVAFRYFGYNLRKEKVFRHNGKVYEVSPYSLILDNENYYLLAYDAEDGIMKHYRVDKMFGVVPGKAKRSGKEVFAKVDMSTYNRKLFGMFGGEEKQVKIRFSNELIDAAVDVLGRDVFITPDGAEHFVATASVVPSAHFLGWIFALGEGAEILFPRELREEMLQRAEKITKQYK